MATIDRKYLPFLVLLLISRSIRLDRPSFWNFLFVAIGAPTAWVVSPPRSRWGRIISIFLACMALAMSPLRSPLATTARKILLKCRLYSRKKSPPPKNTRDPEPGRLVRTLTNPDPINVLHDPGDDAELDIVAVHGLGSSVETTWTHKSSGKLWLRDFLRLDFPKARIMTFRHNSSWGSQALAKNLPDHGRQLLSALEGRRATDKSRDRPLILIGHSFGGLLIEQALVLAKGATTDSNTKERHERLTNSLAGAIFLGTPHAGSSYSILGKLYCLFNYWDGANPLLLGYMDPGSKETEELEDNFMKYYRDLSFDYHETVPNRVLGMQFEMVVTRSSGTRRGQEWGALDTNHFDLNKYSSRKDASYISVKDKMIEMFNAWTDKMEEEKDVYDANELELLKSLEPCSFTSTLENRKRNLTPGTCEWIADEDEFRKWGSKTNLLWILGNPGSGKTYIAQWIYGHLRNKQKNNVMYFFFDAKNEDSKDLHSLEKFYQTILHQLLKGIKEDNSKLKSRCFQLTRKIILKEGPGETSYIKALCAILAEVQPSFLVIDALDECTKADKEVLRDWLAKIREFPNIRIVITSRSVQRTKQLCDNPLCIQLQLSSVVGRLDADIEKYINNRIEKGEFFPENMSRVVQRLKCRSSGMILYARLMLDILESKAGTEDDYLEEMETLPKTLTALYADRLRNISDKKFASRMLQWLVTCRRPLTVDGLRGVDIIGRTVWPKKQFDLDKNSPPKGLGKDRSGKDLFRAYLLRDLLPLVEVLEDHTVRLVHTTVSQFLLGEEVEEDGEECPKAFKIDVEASHKNAAMTCVTYLRWSSSTAGTKRVDGLAFLENRDLHEYAVLEWPEHCKKSEAKMMATESEKAAVLVGFFGGEEQAFTDWLRARAGLDSQFQAHFGLYGPSPTLPQPLHVTVFFNIWQFGRRLLTRANANVRDATGSTALHIAADQGYPVIVAELLQHGAHMNLVDDSGASPLHRAVRRGNHEALGELLAADSADAVLSVSDRYKFTPMHVACQFGWTRCVAMLLEHGASLANDSGAIESPIGLAIENGHVDVVRAALEHDKSMLEHCCGPLVQAARRGSTEMVKFLCEAGVDTSYNDFLGQTVLHKACIAGKTNLVEYLLKSGRVSVDAKDESQRTSLYFAAERGHLDVVDCLLRHGANKNSLDRRRETALFKPAGNGHTAVVKRLLDAGTDATILDLWQRTPLRFAAMKGRLDIVRMLLERTEIQQDLPDWIGRTVLHNAAANLREGQEETIDVLFAHGAQANTTDGSGQTALHAAILREPGHPPPTNALLDRLIQHGVPIEARDGGGRTALFLATATRNPTAVAFLLGAGAVPANQALHVAVQLGNMALLQPFLEHRDKLELAEPDWYANTPLHIAASQGKSDLVEALLAAGAPTVCLNMDQQTPLGAVDKDKHPKTAQLLHNANPTPGGDLENRMANLDISAPNLQDTLGRTPLHAAVLLGRLESVRQLLDANANTEMRDQIGRTPLHYAAQLKDPAIAEALIMANSDVNAADARNRVPLYLAAEAGNITATHILIAANAELIASLDKRTPLHAAALSGSALIVRALLETERGKGLISAQDNDQRTALHLAAERGDVDALEELLSHVQDVAVVDIRDNEERTALSLASDKGHFRAVQQLIRAGSIIYRTDKHRRMAQHLAARKGHLEIVELLLDQLPSQVKVAIEKCKESFPTWPSDEACSEQSFLAALVNAKGLVKNLDDQFWGPDPAKWDILENRQKLEKDVVSGLRTFDEEKLSVSSTTLMQAVEGGNIDMVKLLLAKVPEMPLHAVHYSFHNVLSLAAKLGHVQITQCLIEAGSEVNAIADKQETCLHEAAENGHAEIVELLLQHKANPDRARLRDGSTPLHLAAREGHETTVRTLARVAYVNAADDLGRTPMHVACLGGHSAVVDVLVDADADLAALDFDHRMPLELADGLSAKTQAYMEERAKIQRQRRVAKR